jgi:pimeloyl-ACP methyl ester carboxylesterase
MKRERIKRIEIDWRDLFKPIEGLETAPRDDPLINEIVVDQQIIPIIFVPGTMASRLKHAGKAEKAAWDPDDWWFMGKNYYAKGTPAHRRRMLVGDHSHDPGYLEVDLENEKHNRKLPPGRDLRGWGGVPMRYYGKLLKTLDYGFWAEPIGKCFHLPVYAFGYNWSESNHESGRKLSAYIEQVIGRYSHDTECNSVILVTHSMGGLVARSACILHGAAGKVLGVVHGAQPAAGSPAAYYRMKCGFEPPGSPNDSMWDWLRDPIKLPISKFEGKAANRILGAEGGKVAILMAHMPGALELLPNKLYRTNNGSAQWLTYSDSRGVPDHLPKEDPYTEIYNKKEVVYRLLNPEWIDGRASNDTKGYNVKNEDFWDAYIENLAVARKFHDQLQDQLHPETFQFYSTGIKTADRVEIECKSMQGVHLLDALEEADLLEIRDRHGQSLAFEQGFDKWGAGLKDTYRYRLKPPCGSGDGTVPDSSARFLKVKVSDWEPGEIPCVDINEYDENWYRRQHADIYQSKTAIQIAKAAIENLCLNRIRKETGA